MSEFLVSSACKGRKPEKVLGRRLIPRPDLVARLLRERHVARFIVAPAGFGKSSLAFEYADTVYAFKHVFWVNCKSPCFLRDLDEGIIAARLRELDGASFLAVFEDVPLLDAPRVEAFSLLVDVLLEGGCEVIVTCTPSCDAYSEHHRDRMKLPSSDLLLTDRELAATAAVGDAQHAPRAAIEHRIPCMCWGNDDGSMLLAGVAREELPGDVKLVLFAMLALRRGLWSDLETFAAVGKVRDAALFLKEGYPLLGIDARSERFETVAVSVAVLARAFDKALVGIAPHSHFGERGVLVTRFADALLARGEGGQACAFAGALASKTECAEWLARRGSALLNAGCIQPAHELYTAIGRNKGDYRAALNSREAWRLVLLGNRDGALALARRTAYAVRESSEDRAVALLVLALHGEDDVRRNALAALSALLDIEGVAMLLPDGSIDVAPVGSMPDWSMVACIALALEKGVHRGAEAWEACARSCSEPFAGALCSAAAMVLDAAARETCEVRRGREARRVREGGGLCLGREDREDREGCEGRGGREGALADVAAFAAGAIEAKLDDELGFCLASLTLSLARACESGAVALDYAPEHRMVVLARRVELGVYEQRTEYRHFVEQGQDERAEYRATHPDAFRLCAAPRDALPPTKVAQPLRISLFGGLEVRMGDALIDPLLFRRRKVKILLAVLVLNKGREISHERLLAILWPDKKMETARKNLYSVWSQLRRALSAADGSCPYLIRERGGCRLDARLVECDVTQFDEVCRTLLFGRVEGEEWERVLAAVHDRFADDLMPSEQENDFIVRTRREFCMRLVDGLLAASSRLMKAGEVNGCLWFAREALRRDRTREDVYVALMEAQLAGGQRAAALETYFALRRYLAEELGIDPSTKTVRLYRDIIESEDVVDW